MTRDTTLVEPVVEPAWRDGNLLVISKTSVLPAFCVKCGQPAVSPSLKRTFSWHPRWMNVLLFLGVLLGIIIIAIASTRMTVAIPLCPAHRKKYRSYGFVALSLLLGFIPVIGTGFYFPDYGGLGLLIGLSAFVAGIVFLSLYSGILKTVEIDKSFGRFKDASDSFLNLLDPYPAERLSHSKNEHRGGGKWLAAATGSLLLLGLLWIGGAYVAVWIWPDSTWSYEWLYSLDSDLNDATFSVDPIPHDCEFLTAPIGSKHCHHNKRALTVRIRTENSERFLSIDEGKTWSKAEPSDRAAIYVSWEKVVD